KEAIHLILTGIGYDIYSTVDACQTVQEMWEAIERFVTIVKQQHKLDEVSYHKLFDILKQYQNKVNELLAEKLARNANLLALVATAQASQDPFYQSSRSHRSQAPSPKPLVPSRLHTSTRHKGKEIAKPITPPSETAEEDSDPEQAQRDKDMQKNLALIAKYFKKIYKPTNNNLRTSLNSKNKNVDTTPRYKNDDHSGQFGTQRTVNIANTREKVGSQVVQKTGIQCFNRKEYGHFAKECRKPKKVKDSAYHKEKMLLCKQAEQGVLLQAKQYDCNTCLVETDDSNVIPDSPDMCEDDIQNDEESDDERVALANLIANLKLDVDENKKIQKQLKKANTTLAQELKECKAILAKTTVEATDNSPAVPEHTIVETPTNMSPENKAHFLAEKEAIHLILTGIGDDIYSIVDACQTAPEIWEAIERLQQGESLNIQDVKTNLFWEFGKFTSHEGETMESNYTRFYKLMNDMIRNNLTVTTMPVNVQFLQQLQPEWSRFVTIVKQQHKLDEVSYHKLFDILKQYQSEFNELRAEKLGRNANPLALVTTAQVERDPYYQTTRSHRSQAPLPKPLIPSRSHTSIRHKGKEITKPITPLSETAFEEDIWDLKDSECCWHKGKSRKSGLRTPRTTRRRCCYAKKAEQGVSLQVEQYNWLADTDEEVDEQELEAHYSYMAKIQEVPNADLGTDSELVEQVQKNIEYNVFANDLQHSEQSEYVSNTCLVEADDSNVTPNSPGICEDDIQNEQND
nr:hypothetical protein [Tanacetum cinerariifolium]